MTSARKKLDAVEAQLARAATNESALRREYGEADAAVSDLRARLTRAVEAGAVGADGSTTDRDMVALHADLATAEARLQSGAWASRAQGLENAKRRLERERSQIATEGFGALSAEIAADGAQLHAEVVAVRAQIEALARRWQDMGTTWMTLERAVGVQRAGRLDIPDFPIAVTGDLDAPPVPPALAADPDPVLRTA